MVILEGGRWHSVYHTSEFPSIFPPQDVPGTDSSLMQETASGSGMGSEKNAAAGEMHGGCFNSWIEWKKKVCYCYDMV